ncbi:MAG: DHH family phosphoesterase [Nanoarchaeota archaeon]
MHLISLARTREMLENSQNPFFVYDSDADGFCSSVLLRRWLARGSGEIVRSNPEIDERYAGKALSHGADLVVVLDRHSLGADFVATLTSANVPILWIDHHKTERVEWGDFVYYYNPHFSGDELSPVTNICYNLTARKEDMWIAMIGCIADHYLPSFNKDFGKKYKGFWGNVKKPFDAYYDTEIGRLARAISFGIKDSLSSVRRIEDFFISCISPELAREELDSDSDFAQNVRVFFKRYDELYAEALRHKGKLIFFRYAGMTSMSAEIANKLSHNFPKSIIVVAYVKSAISNISMRGKNVLDLLNRVLVHFPGASGGGHADAVGMRIKTSLLDEFKERLELEIL